MITTGIMAKLHLFHLYVKHWGGGKSFLSGLEDCKKIKRGTLRKGYLLWVASLPKHSQDKSTARRWMVMARQGERQGVYAKSSNPKPYLKLTFLDKKKKRQRRKGSESIPHQQSDKYLKGATGQLAVWWHPHERNWTLDFWVFIDPVKNIYCKKKLCVKVFK